MLINTNRICQNHTPGVKFNPCLIPWTTLIDASLSMLQTRSPITQVAFQGSLANMSSLASSSESLSLTYSTGPSMVSSHSKSSSLTELISLISASESDSHSGAS